MVWKKKKVTCYYYYNEIYGTTVRVTTIPTGKTRYNTFSGHPVYIVRSVYVCDLNYVCSENGARAGELCTSFRAAEQSGIEFIVNISHVYYILYIYAYRPIILYIFNHSFPFAHTPLFIRGYSIIQLLKISKMTCSCKIYCEVKIPFPELAGSSCDWQYLNCDRARLVRCAQVKKKKKRKKCRNKIKYSNTYTK